MVNIIMIFILKKFSKLYIFLVWSKIVKFYKKLVI